MYKNRLLGRTHRPVCYRPKIHLILHNWPYFSLNIIQMIGVRPSKLETNYQIMQGYLCFLIKRKMDSWNYKSEDLENPNPIYMGPWSDEKSEIDIFSSGNVFIVGGDEFIFISKFSIC